MGKITEIEAEFTTQGANEVVAVDFPGRVNLKKVSVVRVGGGNITVDLYNRAFTDDVITPSSFRAVSEAEETEMANAQLLTAADLASATVVTMPAELIARPGDEVTIANTTDYDGSQRVAWVSSDLKRALLDVDHVQDRSGDINLDIIAASQPLAQVMPQQTGIGSLVYFPEFDGGTLAFHNRDVIRPSYNIGVNRMIYMRMADAASYKVSLAAEEVIT